MKAPKRHWLGVLEKTRPAKKKRGGRPVGSLWSWWRPKEPPPTNQCE